MDEALNSPSDDGREVSGRLHFAVTAVGQDRPGIVAAVTGALYRLGCNLEETSMARLRDQFAMLLIVGMEEQRQDPAGALRRELDAVAASLGLTLALRALESPSPGAPNSEGAAAPAAPYILRLYGADRPGIVHRVTSLLAERHCNITDLNTRTFPGADGPVYVMLLEVDLPPREEAAALAPELERLRAELGVEITFEALDQETL